MQIYLKFQFRFLFTGSSFFHPAFFAHFRNILSKEIAGLSKFLKYSNLYILYIASFQLKQKSSSRNWYNPIYTLLKLDLPQRYSQSPALFPRKWFIRIRLRDHDWGLQDWYADEYGQIFYWLLTRFIDLIKNLSKISVLNSKIPSELLFYYELEIFPFFETKLLENYVT